MREGTAARRLASGADGGKTRRQRGTLRYASVHAATRLRCYDASDSFHHGEWPTYFYALYHHSSGQSVNNPRERLARQHGHSSKRQASAAQQTRPPLQFITQPSPCSLGGDGGQLARAHMGLRTVSAGAQANSLVVTFACHAPICGTASSCCCHYRSLQATPCLILACFVALTLTPRNRNGVWSVVSSSALTKHARAPIVMSLSGQPLLRCKRRPCNICLLGFQILLAVHCSAHREAAAYGTWMIQATEAPAPATA